MLLAYHLIKMLLDTVAFLLSIGHGLVDLLLQFGVVMPGLTRQRQRLLYGGMHLRV
ncbi:hypothetical protein [Pseudomonas sp.]|uniref:hypothetical protein n=1 Tax=Pseudomonas sp. TaxID=306 RepID=UPI003CC615A9